MSLKKDFFANVDFYLENLLICERTMNVNRLYINNLSKKLS